MNNLNMNNNPMIKGNIGKDMNNLNLGINNINTMENDKNDETPFYLSGLQLSQKIDSYFKLLPNYIKVKILFNDIYFFTYKIYGRDKASNEKVYELIKNVLSQLKINDNIDEYQFYHEKELLDNLKLNDTCI